MVVVNKIETLPDEEVAAKIEALEKACGKKVVAISAVAKKNLLQALRAVSPYVTRDRRRRDAEMAEDEVKAAEEKKPWSPLDNM